MWITPKRVVNQFHGSVPHDVNSSSALSFEQRPEKANEGLTSVPVSIQNDAGFSIGGPVRKRQAVLLRHNFRYPHFGLPRQRQRLCRTAEGFAALRSLFPQAPERQS